MNFLEGSRKSGNTLESSNTKLVSDEPINLEKSQEDSRKFERTVMNFRKLWKILEGSG